jgi:hypothetical protein
MSEKEKKRFLRLIEDEINKLPLNQNIINIPIGEPYIQTYFVNLIIHYLKYIATSICYNYIDNKFRNLEDQQNITCLYKDQITLVYNLIVEYRKLNTKRNRSVFRDAILPILNNLSIVNITSEDALSERIALLYSIYYEEKRRKDARRQIMKDINREPKKKTVETAAVILELNIDESYLTDSSIREMMEEYSRDPTHILDKLNKIKGIYFKDKNSIDSLNALLKTLNIRLGQNGCTGKIDTVILKDIDIITIKQFIDKIYDYNLTIEKLILILKTSKHVAEDSGDVPIESDFIILLNMINIIENITHLEISGFNIDLRSKRSSDNEVDNGVFEIFSEILKKLTYVNFVGNGFHNSLKEKAYDEFIKKYNLADNSTKLKVFIEWVYSNPGQQQESYIYKKWLEWLYSKEEEKKEKKKVSDTTATQIEIITRDLSLLIKDNEKYKRYLRYRGFSRLFYKKEDEDEDYFYEWFAWLLTDGKFDSIFFNDENDWVYDQISIVIKFYKNKSISVDDIHQKIIDIIKTKFNKDVLIDKIQKEYGKYDQTQLALSNRYNKIILDKMVTTDKEMFVVKISAVTGGRKINSKSLLPKKAPKKAPTKEPKKTRKKVPKVVLKEPNTYAVIKQKIRIKTVK